MRTVITYGTFDLFHVGHLKLFERLSALGDRLYVGVSTDEFNANKGKKTIVPFSNRIQIVRAIRYVTDAFPEETWEQKRNDILRYKADVFAMGEDWAGKFDHLANVCEVVYLPRTVGVSSTQIKNNLQLFSRSQIDNINSSIQTIAAIVRAMDVEG